MRVGALALLAAGLKSSYAIANKTAINRTMAINASINDLNLCFSSNFCSFMFLLSVNDRELTILNHAVLRLRVCMWGWARPARLGQL